jgi:hypothetical protein
MRRIEQTAQFLTEINPGHPASLIFIIFIFSGYKLSNPLGLQAWDLKFTRALTFIAFCYRKDIQRIRTLRVLFESELRDSPLPTEDPARNSARVRQPRGNRIRKEEMNSM